MTDPFSPPVEFEWNTFWIFNLTQIRKFIIENNVFVQALSFLIATQLRGVVDAILNGIVNPIVQRDGNNDGEAEIKYISDWETPILGIKFKFGSIIVEFIKFLFVLYMPFIITRLLRDIVN